MGRRPAVVAIRRAEMWLERTSETTIVHSRELPIKRVLYLPHSGAIQDGPCSRRRFSAANGSAAQSGRLSSS